MWPTFYIPKVTRPGGVEYSGPVIYPWLGANRDPRNSLNLHEYRIYNGYADTFTTLGKDYATNFSQFYTFHNSAGSGRNNNPLIDNILGWSLADGDNQQEPIGPLDMTTDYCCVDVYLWYAAGTPTVWKPQLTGSSGINAIAADLTRSTLNYHSGSTTPGDNHGIYYVGTSGVPTYNTPSLSGSFPSYGLAPGETLRSWNDESLVVRRLPSPPSGSGWTLVSGTAKVLSVYSTGTGAPGGYRAQTLTFGGTTHIQKYQYRPNGTCLIPSDPNYNSSSWWTARYNEAVAADTMPSGKAYGTDYPVVVSSYYMRHI